jgi:tetratricopeptide (TPR) repeat protein
MDNKPDLTEKESLQALLKKGYAELTRGNLEAAGACCRQVLEIRQDLAPAHFLVALVAQESKDRRTAFSAFQSVVKLDPDHGAAWAHLAKLYMSEGKVNKADKALRETLRIKPEDPLVMDLIGTTLSLMGEYGAARTFYESADKLLPNHPPFMQNLANNLVYHGDTDQSDTIFRRILDIQPDNPQSHWSLASSTRATDTSHIEAMQKLLERHRGNPRGRAFYLYAIGKEYEDLKQWPEAFAAFSAGAAARRETVEYDEAAEIEMFDYLRCHYTQDWFAGLPEGNPDESPIFVLGQPRTGTTLVERVITAHSQVHSAGELQQFGLAVRRLANHRDAKRFSTELFAAARELEPRKLGGMYLQASWTNCRRIT